MEMQQQDIEAQLREWKAQMRAERSQRLAQAAAVGSLSTAGVTGLEIPPRANGGSALREGHSNTTADQGGAATAFMAGRGPKAHSTRPAATLEEYKKEVDELAFPAAPATRLARYRRVQRRGEDEGRTSEPTQERRGRVHSVDPHDVTFHEARSVVGEYIRRPASSATRESRRASVPARSTSARKTRSAAGHPGRQDTAVSSRLTYKRSAFARNSANDPTANDRPPRRTDEPPATEPRHVAASQNTSGWTRAALLRHEATVRTLKQRERENGKPRTASATRTSSRAPLQRSGAHHVVDTTITSSQHPDSSTAAVQPARMLFTHAPDEAQGQPLSSRLAPPTTMESRRTASPHREPATRSRFMPTIRYSSNWRPDASAQPREPLTRDRSQSPRSWHQQAAAQESDWASARLSVSPPTPSPLGTRERRAVDTWPRRWDRPAAAETREPSARRVPMTEALEDSRAAAAPAWEVPGPSLARPDLFQGGAAVATTAHAWDRREEAAPRPRTVQPHPRPVWFREER